MSVEIKFLSNDQVELYAQHLKRHMEESGIDDNIVYSPFDRGFNHPITKMIDNISNGLDKKLDELHWQRAFVALDGSQIVGHLDLQGGYLKSSMHRVRLGMGLDRNYRGQKIGFKLMQTALDWLKSETHIKWVDLDTFAHNSNAIALYKKFGFEVIGITRERFMVDNQAIDDQHMCLKIKA